MLVVSVELHSAVNGSRTQLARMHICNDGQATLSNPRLGDYYGMTFVGRDARALAEGRISKRGEVHGWRRADFHVWNLVRRMLEAMGYDKGAGVSGAALGLLTYQEPDQDALRITLPDGSLAWVEHQPDASRRRWPECAAEYQVWLQDEGHVYVSAAVWTFEAAVRNVMDVCWSAAMPFEGSELQQRLAPESAPAATTEPKA